ncbi:MAG: hypothetical protein OHK0022_43270 [Roseiflexaceae bacterium]
MMICETTLQEVERLWGGGKLSNEEAIGCLLHYLVRQEEKGEGQEPRTKNQEPSRQDQALSMKNQEPRTKNQGSPIRGGAFFLRDELDHTQTNTQHVKRKSAGWQQFNTQHSKLNTPKEALGTLLRQMGDALDALTGQQLELWHADGLWYWRWEDTDELARCGLASYGEALVDAIEQRYPDDLLPAALRSP